ncbi:uncharacterized protein A4U43_C04F26820 [Asparagus officinalis]|uniref:Uncharacterized protein n=1 Tax=Asparagus officinalis TaxID=4686 RepID=A0A5P1F3X7_ASPOF|nr:uncharacterized protein A4U43_C04F26820 [Asparagus officinalis]
MSVGGPAKFLWRLGFAHYWWCFVTLYQRLPTVLPKELHPVYSMFIATPSAASVSWRAIYGEFDAVSRTFFFIALFLYISLVVRINFFRGFKFSLAWWSYTFPMATVYKVPNALNTLGLALYLSIYGIEIFISSFLMSVIDGVTESVAASTSAPACVPKHSFNLRSNRSQKRAERQDDRVQSRSYVPTRGSNTSHKLKPDAEKGEKAWPLYLNNRGRPIGDYAEK